MVTTLASWNGEELRVVHDEATDGWIIVAIHSTRRGPAAGGVRLKAYPSVEGAVEDALRLSAGMTRKNAVAGLPCGGGKGVIAIPPSHSTEDRRRLLLMYAGIVESLDGRFMTGLDFGTSEADMDVIGTVTSHVFCRSTGAGGSGDASPWTAAGVFHGLRASVRHGLATDDLGAVSVLVQGAGDVGARLVGLLVAAGADVIVADTDAGRVRLLADRYPRVSVLPPERVYETNCDVFAPCAVGGILNRESIALLKARVIAGAANNQLAEAADAERLRVRGILYAPDYVINAGGIIRAVGKERLGWSDAQVDERIEGIAETLADIYRIADSDSITTAAAAERLVDRAGSPARIRGLRAGLS